MGLVGILHALADALSVGNADAPQPELLELELDELM